MKDKLIAAVTLGITVAAACYVLDAGSCRECTPEAKVLVAAEYLAPGTLITEDKLEIASVPRQYLQFGAFPVENEKDMMAPLGLVTVVRIPKGDQITQNCLSAPGARINSRGKTSSRKMLSGERYLEGLRFYQNADYDRAEAEWKAALKLYPENPDAAAGLERINKIKAAR